MHAGDAERNARTKLMAAWDAELHSKTEQADVLRCPELQRSDLARTVSDAIRGGGANLSVSLNEVLSLMKANSPLPHTYIDANVFAPSSIGGTVEEGWRQRHLLGKAWDVYSEHDWQSGAAPLDDLPDWEGLCFAPDPPELATVRRTRRCTSVMAEAGSNVYILHRLPALARLYSLADKLCETPAQVSLGLASL